MFYTLSDPAPVYDCEDFTHQLDYFERGHNNRELIYFPETAWWLGFDNNVPLATPIVGPSRFQDITKIKNDFSVTGHVTFTTGREWTYWMYDHYLTRVTWDSRLDWSSYLSSIAPIYGRASSQSLTLLNEWTERQLTDLYETNPEIYFYLSGELPQDEVGEVGITAADPSVPFTPFSILMRHLMKNGNEKIWRFSMKSPRSPKQWWTSCRYPEHPIPTGIMNSSPPIKFRRYERSTPCRFTQPFRPFEITTKQPLSHI